MSIEELKQALHKAKKLKITIRVKPGAPKSELLGFMSDASLKISLQAVPEDNKANAELIKFLAKTFAVSLDQVKIISGTRTRLKRLKITLD